jgi:hypothetical protein
MTSPAYRPVQATPQQRATARLAARSYADVRAILLGRVEMWEIVHPDDPEVQRVSEEVRRVCE